MCQRNSVCKSQTSTTTLRRSPRFLQQDQTNTDNNPKTPDPVPRRIRGSSSNLTPLNSTGKCFLEKPRIQRRGEVAEKAKIIYTRLKISENLSTEHPRSAKLGLVSKESWCLRRSPRFSENCNLKDSGFEESKQKDSSKAEKLSDSCRKSDKGRRVTRSSIGGNKEEVADTGGRVTRSSIRGNKEEVADTAGRVTRSSIRGNKEEVADTGRRVTRSSIGGNKQEVGTGSGNGVFGYFPGEALDVQSRSGKQTVTAEVNLSKQCLYRIEKRITRSSNHGTDREDSQKCNFKGDKPIEHDSVECLDKGVISQEQNVVIDMKQSCKEKSVNRRKCRVSLPTNVPGEANRKGSAHEVEKNLVGMKRKRVETKEGHRIVQGWTREQELALQRAYFASKPTPHFWKKVSKMVPGKSAQDCFDKIHADHLTPPQPQPRSRVKERNSSLSFSASKLLNSSEPKRKKVKNSKQMTSLSRKAVRELLQKQCKIDQGAEADLFTVLEPTLHPSTRTISDGSLCSTPECNKKGPSFLKRCLERSSSAQRKQLSRLNASSGTTLTSPPVLKQVKNKAMHEKYIDQLHTREAKRNAASLKATKCFQRKHDAKPDDALRSEVVKAAKDALIFEARDAIDQFHHLQNCTTNSDDDDFPDIAEDEIEYGS